MHQLLESTWCIVHQRLHQSVQTFGWVEWLEVLFLNSADQKLTISCDLLRGGWSSLGRESTSRRSIVATRRSRRWSGAATLRRISRWGRSSLGWIGRRSLTLQNKKQVVSMYCSFGFRMTPTLSLRIQRMTQRSTICRAHLYIWWLLSRIWRLGWSSRVG